MSLDLSGSTTGKSKLIRWSGRGIRNRAVGITLIGIPIAMSVLGTIVGFLVGPEDFTASVEATLLFMILPVVGSAHLMYLAKPADPTSAAALA